MKAKMIKEAKNETYFNFARIISFNRLQSLELTRNILYSLIPKEYHD